MKKKGSISKEFKSIPNLKAKDLDIIRLLSKNQIGLRADVISKLTHINQRNLYKKLNKLKNKGLIFNAYPIWKLTPRGIELFEGSFLKSSKELVELHDLSFVIKLLNKPDWWEKRHNRLRKYNIQNIKWGNNPFQQETKDGAVIQYFSNSIIIMIRKRYYGLDSYSCFLQGLSDFFKIYDKLESDLKFKFFEGSIPQITIRSQHYVNIGDVVAKVCKKTGNKFEVVVDGKLRMWVDMSEPLGVEAGHRDYAPEDMSRYQPYVRDIILNNPPKPSEMALNQEILVKDTQELVNVIKDVVENQKQHQESMVYLDRNLKTHFEVLDKIGKAVDRLSKEVAKLNKKKR